MNVRHYLKGESSKYWGHIGYGIRPTERKKGYATIALKLAIEKAKKMNLKEIRLGAYEGNVGSWKTMEKCNAHFVETKIEKETGLPVKIYRINLK